MARDYVCLYHSYLDAITELGDAEKGRLFTAALVYSATGETMELCGNERYVFPMIRGQIDRDKASYQRKCETNRSNVSARYDGIRTPTTVNERIRIAQGKGKGECKDKGKGEGDIGVQSTPKRENARFIPPTLEECIAYFAEKGSTDVEARKFFLFYEGKGWKVGRNPMQKWRSSASGWILRNSTGDMPRGSAPRQGSGDQMMRYSAEERRATYSAAQLDLDAEV